MADTGGDGRSLSRFVAFVQDRFNYGGRRCFRIGDFHHDLFHLGRFVTEDDDEFADIAFQYLPESTLENGLVSERKEQLVLVPHSPRQTGGEHNG